MRTSLTLLVFAIALVAAPTHRFVCSDYTQGKVFIVDAEGRRVVFSYESGSEVYACQRRRNRRDLLTCPVTRGK
jgi:hypothetical protein